MPTNDLGAFLPNEDLKGTQWDKQKSEPTTFNPDTVKQKPLTFGQKLVGLTFNPSGDAGVNKAKQLCADLADLVNDHWENKEHSRLENQLYDHTIGEILNAQMNVVKLLTLKY